MNDARSHRTSGFIPPRPATAYATTSERFAAFSTASAVSQLAVSTPSLNTMSSARPASDSPIMIDANVPSMSEVSPTPPTGSSASLTFPTSPVNADPSSTRWLNVTSAAWSSFLRPPSTAAPARRRLSSFSPATLSLTSKPRITLSGTCS